MEKILYLIEVFGSILLFLMGTFRAYYAIKDKNVSGCFDKTFIVLFIIGTPILAFNIYATINHHNIPLLRLPIIIVSFTAALIVGVYYDRQNRKHDARSNSDNLNSYIEPMILSKEDIT